MQVVGEKYLQKTFKVSVVPIVCVKLKMHVTEISLFMLEILVIITPVEIIQELLPSFSVIGDSA